MTEFGNPPRISLEERLERLARLRAKMAEAGLGAVLLGATVSLRYFTGWVWHSVDRLAGAVITATEVFYFVPGFERSRAEGMPQVPGEMFAWEEDEVSVALAASFVPEGTRLGVDHDIPLFVYRALARVVDPARLFDAEAMLRGMRMKKSPAEIAIIRHGMNITHEVQRLAHGIIAPGVRARDVIAFIDAQHRAFGADDGSSFCLVSYGATTALPHATDTEKAYTRGEPVLIDTGCHIDGYNSDMTRTYLMEGDRFPAFERIWAIEREAELAVFEAAKLGVACGHLDDVARAVLAGYGLGPDYKLPGLPHRTGHGMGLIGHEDPFIVRGNDIALEEGMCFTVEPMIVLPDQFGIRLEDVIHMTDEGPKWFNQPSKSVTEPF